MRRAGLVDIAALDQLLHVVGNVGALIIAAVDEIADDDLFVADIGEQEGLDRIEVLDAQTIEFRPDDIEESPVQTLNHSREIKIGVVHGLVIGGLQNLGNRPVFQPFRNL